MKERMSKVTVSAGGVVVNPKGEILLIHQDKTTWSFPKGHVEKGEEPLDAALREIMEESGVNRLDLIRVLDVYGRYKIGLQGREDKHEWKVMIFFLFKTRTNHLPLQENFRHRAQWVLPREVQGLLSHPKDKAFYKSIRPML